MRTSPTRRDAFTLIELLIVISIIAILAGLTAVAVMKALSSPSGTRTESELGQFDGSIQQFMTIYKVDQPPPSKLKLCRNYVVGAGANQYDLNRALDRDSVDYIQKTIGKGGSQRFMTRWTSGINWTSTMTANGDYEILEGHQCLVFFLGGLQIRNGTQTTCVGFNPDPNLAGTQPAAGTGVGPFFDFQSNRLSVPTGQRHVAAYEDPYGRVAGRPAPYYAYFSAYKGNYNRYGANGVAASTTIPAVSDCASLNLWPYASAGPATGTGAIQYVKPGAWQIISPGADGVYGPGTNITATRYFWNATTAGGIASGGKDDHSNFASGKLQYGP